MRIRTLLLVGSTLPFALGAPGLVAGPSQRAPQAVQLAQNCEPGQDCQQGQGQQRRRNRQQQGGQEGQGQQQPRRQQQQQQEGGTQGQGQQQQRRHQQQQESGEQPQGGAQGQQQRRRNQQQQQQGGTQGAEQGGEQGQNQQQRRRNQQQQQQQQQGTEQQEGGAQNQQQQRRRNRQQQQGGEEQQPQGQEQPGGTQGTEQGTGGEQQGEQQRRRNRQQQGNDQQQQGGEQGTEQGTGGEQQGEQQRRRNRQQQQGNDQQQEQGGQQGAGTEGGTTSEQDSTVEQQLEAQGDRQEADSVRSLRQRLRQQLEGAGVFPEEGGTTGGNRRDRDRNRNRDRDEGWWNRDDDRNVVDRRNGRIIIDLGNGNLSVEQVAPDEGGRLLYGADNVEVQRLEEGRTRTIVYRDNGVQIITNRDRFGNIISRVKRLPGGRDIYLIDNTVNGQYYGDKNPPILYDVPPPVIGIPEDQYIVDYGDASEEDLVRVLRAPPVAPPPRRYTLDEVLANQEVRAYSPRIDLDTITFETGSAVIGPDQMRTLVELGQAMEEVLNDNPDEVYLIEGHTDAVGDPEDNLILSDERAESVATALSQNFNIPPENLVTKGYGEEYLKVDTGGPERQNRRATIRRLTELLQAQNQ